MAGFPFPTHIRHQSSLERILNPPSEAALDISDRVWARFRFHKILDLFEQDVPADASPYDHSSLIRLTYANALSETSRDKFTQAFLNAMGFPTGGVRMEITMSNDLRQRVCDYADYLLDGFFLPMRVSRRYLRRAADGFHVDLRLEDRSETLDQFDEQVDYLWTTCRARDRHRCVVTQSFDHGDDQDLFPQDDPLAVDDSEVLLLDDLRPIASGEVTCILPPSLSMVHRDPYRKDAKKTALDILNMLDNGVIQWIQGPDTYRPRNGVTLCPRAQGLFVEFKMYFESIPWEPHTYRIDTYAADDGVRRAIGLPVTRNLCITDSRIIEPPCGRFLAIHCAIARILNFSGVNRYIDKVIFDGHHAQTRGSTPLDRLFKLCLGGWLEGMQYKHSGQYQRLSRVSGMSRDSESDWESDIS